MEPEWYYFFVSCNPELEYIDVIVPDFVQEKTHSSLFASKTGTSGDITETEKGNAIYFPFYNSPAGDLTLVFRVVECYEDDLYEDNLKDGKNREFLSIGNRQVLWVMGFTCKGILEPSEIKIEQKHFDEIYEEIKPHYRNFWEWTTYQPAITISKTIDLSLSDNQNLLKIVEKQPGLFKKNLSWQGREPLKLQKETEEIVSVAYLPNKKDTIIYSFAQTAIIYDLKNQKTVNTLFQEKNYIKTGYYFTPIAINNNGKYLATGIMPLCGFENNVLKIWENEKELFSCCVSNNIVNRLLDSWNKETNIGFNGIRSLAFTPMNTILACQGTNRKVFIYDLNGNPIEIGNDTLRTRTISVDYKNNCFASGNLDGDIIIWELNRRGTSATKKKGPFKAHGTPDESPVTALSFSPNGKILASAGEDFFIKLWDPSTGKPTKPEDLGDQGCCINTLVFNPTNNNELASGDENGVIKIWNINDGTSKKLTGHQGAVTSLSFSPDGKSLVSGSKDKTIRLWKKL